MKHVFHPGAKVVIATVTKTPSGELYADFHYDHVAADSSLDHSTFATTNGDIRFARDCEMYPLPRELSNFDDGTECMWIVPHFEQDETHLRNVVEEFIRIDTINRIDELEKQILTARDVLSTIDDRRRLAQTGSQVLHHSVISLTVEGTMTAECQDSIGTYYRLKYGSQIGLSAGFNAVVSTTVPFTSVRFTVDANTNSFRAAADIFAGCEIIDITMEDVNVPTAPTPTPIDPSAPSEERILS